MTISTKALATAIEFIQLIIWVYIAPLVINSLRGGHTHIHTHTHTYTHTHAHTHTRTHTHTSIIVSVCMFQFYN